MNYTSGLLGGIANFFSRGGGRAEGKDSWLNQQDPHFCGSISEVMEMQSVERAEQVRETLPIVDNLTNFEICASLSCISKHETVQGNRIRYILNILGFVRHSIPFWSFKLTWSICCFGCYIMSIE